MKIVTLVIGGASAGGLAVYMWTNFITDKIKAVNPNPSVQIHSIPSSGIFLDELDVRSNQPNYKQSFQQLMKFTNVEIDPPVPDCIARYPTAK